MRHVEGEIFTVICNKNTVNLELDVVALLLCLEEIKRYTKEREININTLRT
jgi:hypothetical protein